MPSKPPLRFVTAFSAYTANRSDQLGEGGNGTVYRAVEEGTGADVAVKVLDPGKATKEKTRRFKNEILFGQAAGHPNVLAVQDAGSIALDGRDAPFYVMPRYAATLRHLMNQGAGIPPDRVLPLYAGLLDGVEAAHLKGVVHRDLKPENVLYDAERDALVVADFGIAHFAAEDPYTAVNTRPMAKIGNFQYAAPEQRTPGREIDARADIYALGLVLNEMFTGTVPHGTAYRTVAPVAPAYAPVDLLVEAMLQQSRRKRPATVDAVRQQLPSSPVADPLVADPVRVVDTDTSVPNALVLVLNHAPTPKWKAAMAQAGGYGHYPDHDPRQMTIVGNRVTIRTDRSRGVEPLAVAGTYVEFFRAMADAYARALAREEEQRRWEARNAEAARVEAERRRLEWNKALGI